MTFFVIRVFWYFPHNKLGYFYINTKGMIQLRILLIFLFFFNTVFSQEIKDKTKYYVKNIENFNNYSSNGWDLLDNKQLKIVAKALNINTEEAQKIIDGTRSENQPKNKKNTDVAYIMYKVCELNGFKNGEFKYDKPDDILYLLYVPNDLNTHLPADKLAENGKGFFQISRKESVSTTPLAADYYKPLISLKNENYSFGFIFGAKGADSIVVLKVLKSSPAEKAGFRINDIITEYNGQNIRYKSRPEASKIFKESAFTNNTFKILRNNGMLTITADKVNSKTLEFVCISSTCDNGECIIESINGYTIKGNCKDGNIIGNAKFTTEDGFVFYEGQVKKLSSTFNNYAYVFHGLGKEKYSNGNSYEGNFVNGKKDGNGVLTFADGSQKKGIWKEDKYYDDISIGFANDRFRVSKERIYLHHLKKDFKPKMVEISDAEKKKVMSKYNFTEAEIDKLFALCDMKYKPSHLNTPQKIRTVIEQNQKDKPYEAYFVAQIYGTDNEVYYIIYLPTFYNNWLPEGVKFDVQDGLYFCVPASVVHFINYYDYERNLAILKGAEEDKKREQEQQKLFAEQAEWSAKNKFKGVFLLQYDGNTSNYATNDDELIRVVSVFGPVNQIFTEADRLILEEKYQSSGWKLKTSNFNENMNEAQAIKYLTEEKGYDRFSINNNYAYTIPERKSKKDADELKKTDAELEKNQQKRDELFNGILENNSVEKTAQAKKTVTDVLSGTKKEIPRDTYVEVISIDNTDKKYNELKNYAGKKGTTKTALKPNSDGTYSGMIEFNTDFSTVSFEKVSVKIIL